MKSITIPPDDIDIDAVGGFVGEILDQHDCPDRVRNQIEVAIEEVLVNISSYAGLSNNDVVEVRCAVVDDPPRMIVQFLDNGIPFNPLAQGNPDISPKGLVEREGGLGIYLVRQMMDKTSYAYENGKNVLTLQKNLS